MISSALIIQCSGAIFVQAFLLKNLQLMTNVGLLKTKNKIYAYRISQNFTCQHIRLYLTNTNCRQRQCFPCSMMSKVGHASFRFF